MTKAILASPECASNTLSDWQLHAGHSRLVLPFKRILLSGDFPTEERWTCGTGKTGPCLSDLSNSRSGSSGATLDLSLPHCEGSTTESLSAKLLHYLLSLQCNGHAVTTVMLQEEERLAMSLCNASSKASTTCLSDGDSLSSDKPSTGQSCVRLALAIFPVTSLLNHSCKPNTLVRCVLL